MPIVIGRSPPIVERDAGSFQRFRSVAFCTPYPPDRSAVADYLRSLIETLCAHHPVKVDVVVKGAPDAYAPPGHKAVSLISARQFRWLADHGHYDTVVYCMANNLLHNYIYELLKERPGVVWLRDVRLTGFYYEYYRQEGRDVSRLPEELLPWARRYPDYQGDVLLRDLVTQHEHGIYMAGEVANYAQTLVVDSCFAKELVEIDSGRRIPVVALPFAAPPVNAESLSDGWPVLASKYGLDQSAYPVISSGNITTLKCPEAVIDAFAAAAPTDANLALAFVGPCEPEYQRQLEQRASRLGIDDRVRFTGYVEEAEFDSWLAVARCAIQLRFPTNGESSAAVMRCLAGGVPTIVSDHGPLRDLPDDAVLKVPTQDEPTTLAAALVHLAKDDRACDSLRTEALRYAQKVSFEAVADRFWTDVLGAPGDA